jgi:Tol biopolymer transport system component
MTKKSAGSKISSWKKRKNEDIDFAFILCRILLITVAPVILLGCDLEIPSSTSYPLPSAPPNERVVFHSSYTYALAWHPDGNRLAVAERAGAEFELVGLHITDPKVRKLNLSFRFVWRFQAITEKQLLVGESDDGQLLAWPLNGSPPQVFFAGPMISERWSIAADGESFLYFSLPSEPHAPREIRHAKPGGAEISALFDSARSILDAKILPDGKGALILSNEIRAGTIYYNITRHSLPFGQKALLLSSRQSLSQISPSRDGSRFAFKRSRSAQNAYDLMIFDLQRGLVDSLINLRGLSADLVWMENDRWIATFAFNNVPEIRAYDLRTHVSVVLAQNLRFAQQRLLFGIGETLAFFVLSPARLSVFDRRERSFTTWFTIPEGEGEMRSMEWDVSADNLFVWLDNAQTGTVFYLVKPNAAQRYAKNLRYTSVSLHPDGRHFLAISPYVQPAGYSNLLRETLATHEVQLLRSLQNVKSVHVHPSGKFTGLLAAAVSPGSNLPQNKLYIMDFSSNAFIDSVSLPPGGSRKFQWLVPSNDNMQFSAIWLNDTYQSHNSIVYSHVSLMPRFSLPVYSSAFEYPFAVVPKQEEFSLLQGNTLMTIPLNTKVDP